MGNEWLALALPLAVALDFWLGDPPRMPHPVRWMGKAIEILEPRFRGLKLSTAKSGALMTVSLVIGVWLIGVIVVNLANKFNPLVGIVVQAILLFTCISAKDLANAARKVGKALNDSGIEAGRREVSMIVGREVDRLDETGVTRAAVETVAENLVDGVISPIFFAVIGGAPLALAFKMVNTLDSMIGYKNERYLEFGRFAARLDDVVNFVPARLSVPIIALGAKLLNLDWRNVLTVARRDGRLHASPNAGYSEAAFAGALWLWMGGPNIYHGRLVEKPIIGEGLGDALPAHIENACRLMLTTAMLAYALAELSIIVIRGLS